jgi:PAS domain S-box-containing protein
MVVVNREGKIVLVNSQVEKLFGYGREELLGQQSRCWFRNASGATSRTARGFFRPSPRAGHGSGLDLYALRKDGTEFPVDISLSPLDTEEACWFPALFAISRNAGRSKMSSAAAAPYCRASSIRCPGCFWS